MDLQVNIPIEKALDLGWKMLASCFDRNEVGIKQAYIEKYWPKTA
jgi:V/A-type H+-transporting ATPase subunit B